MLAILLTSLELRLLNASIIDFRTRKAVECLSKSLVPSSLHVTSELQDPKPSGCRIWMSRKRPPSLQGEDTAQASLPATDCLFTAATGHLISSFLVISANRGHCSWYSHEVARKLAGLMDFFQQGHLGKKNQDTWPRSHNRRASEKTN